MGKVTGFMEYERLEEGYAPVAERAAKAEASAATDKAKASAATAAAK